MSAWGKSFGAAFGAAWGRLIGASWGLERRRVHVPAVGSVEVPSTSTKVQVSAVQGLEIAASTAKRYIDTTTTKFKVLP